ncbi:MAG: SAM-dependent methyltransferase [Chlamydiae bacterium]|nr:SAM-dependent methyltransferase [Chlamydiota bacterium]
MTLYLLPNLLHPEANPNLSFVRGLKEVVDSLDGFFVETPKEARVYLKHFDFDKLKIKPMEEIQEKNDLSPLVRGEKWGVISDAGLPCIADPGAKLVRAAREKGIDVQAIPGPSSIFLALMLAGLESQSFIFQGYMPRDHKIERLSYLQVFIETPYNNEKTVEKLLSTLHPEDTLSIASDLTLPSQVVVTKKVKDWKERKNFHKKPAIFLIKTR